MLLIELNIAGRRFTRQLDDRRRPVLLLNRLNRQFRTSRAA
ncbi:MAG: hypothetical protein K0R33_1678 [Mycobacterium sp.]|jgi:hypothetical protein|nr:hypothetical protein [Mycobacterium sp.]